MGLAGGQPTALLIELLENDGCEAVALGARGMGDPEATSLGRVAAWPRRCWRTARCR